jgi:hypothetical protein
MTPNDLITIIGVNITLLGAFSGMMYWMMNRIDSDIKSSNTRLDGHAQRIDQFYHMSNAKHDAQMARIDQLYKMFVDLLQAGK